MEIDVRSTLLCETFIFFKYKSKCILASICSDCSRFHHKFHLDATGDNANVIRNRIRTSKLTASRSCAAAAASIKGLRLAGTERRARAARHYMVISCGNLPSELYHGRARQTMPVCPLGTKYHHPERGGRMVERRQGETGARVAVGLDGGDITKMSENVTHLIIYAPRSRRYPLSILPFSLHSSRHLFSSLSLCLSPSLTLPLVHQSSFQQSLPSLHPHFTARQSLRRSQPSGCSVAAAFSREINLTLLK